MSSNGCLARPAEYSAWRAMLARCSDERHSKFRRYGGRGIRVCGRWRDFASFLADLGPRPGLGWSLDRVNNDGHYEPGNCRWADRKEQARNRASNRIVEYRGLRLPAVEMCERFGADYVRFRSRVRAGWDVARAIEAPPGEPTAYLYRGERVTMAQATALAGVTVSAIHARLGAGLDIEQAIETKKHAGQGGPGKLRSAVTAAAAAAGLPAGLVRYRMRKGATLAEACAAPKSNRGRKSTRQATAPPA